MWMLILVAVLTASNFALTKFYQKDGNDSNRELMMFNSLVGLFTGVIFFVVKGFQVEITAYSVLMGLGFSSFVVVYRMVGFKIMEGETISLFTVFLMAGGMILPYIWGLFFLNEEASLLRTIGLLMIVAAMIITDADGGKMKLKTTLMCLAVFIMNGFTSIISKEHQISEGAVSELDFIVICNFVMAISCFLVSRLYKVNKSKQKKMYSPKSIFIIFLVAMVNGIGFFFQLKGAENIDASVLYPVITGGTVIFTAVAGWIFFKEKITVKLATGLILCLAGTCMFL